MIYIDLLKSWIDVSSLGSLQQRKITKKSPKRFVNFTEIENSPDNKTLAGKNLLLCIIGFSKHYNSSYSIKDFCLYFLPSYFNFNTNAVSTKFLSIWILTKLLDCTHKLLRYVLYHDIIWLHWCITDSCSFYSKIKLFSPILLL